MKKTLFVSLIILVLSCSQKKEEVYTPNCLHDSIENRIPRNELDSLLDNLPYWKLDKFKTTNMKESRALEILKEKLLIKGTDIKKLLIYEIIRQNDSTIIFLLEHIDGAIYHYNLNKKNKVLAKFPDKDGYFQVIPPNLGNNTNIEGYYKVDICNDSLEINYTK